MHVYLDDTRPGPENPHWVIVRSVASAKTLLQLGVVEDLSLDHDLGADEETGYDLCKWMAEYNIWPSGEITIHSANPVGRENMRATIQRYKGGQ